MNDATQAAERWLPVPGWEGLYEVSDLGRVRSKDRLVADLGGRRQRMFRGRELQPFVNSQTGRRGVVLKRLGQRETVTIYTLVLLAFVGPPPAGTEACHGDGDCLNDRLDNLRWDTRSANMLDTVLHGTHRHAKRIACKWGHLLTAPNLRPAKDRRDCLACAKARGRFGELRRQGRPLPDYQSLASRYYGEIMKEIVTNGAA